MQTGQIEAVSETAFMAAAYRAIESKRADALFRDLLAGSHGEEIVRHRPRWSLLVQRLVAIRTRIIDGFIETAIAQETTTILNVGAGLDARPLPHGPSRACPLDEIDYSTIVELKERRSWLRSGPTLSFSPVKSLAAIWSGSRLMRQTFRRAKVVVARNRRLRVRPLLPLQS